MRRHAPAAMFSTAASPRSQKPDGNRWQPFGVQNAHEKRVSMKRYDRLSQVNALMAGVLLAIFFTCESARAENAEAGLANFYSDAFHGKKKMFNGEPYDKTKLTASHKKYALGTKLKVTNLENSNSVVVTVTDRMAPKNPAVIDVSRRAAEELGFVKAGKARVKVEAER
jgi:rare lipoprotein A